MGRPASRQASKPPTMSVARAEPRPRPRTPPRAPANPAAPATALSFGAAARRFAWRFYAMKTYVAKPTARERNWLLVDATGQTLGRLATQIANALRGKRKPEY